MDRIRTCIGCRAKSDKRTLHRIVRASDGTARFDETGKMQGRGAYICSIECLQKAKRSSQLRSALRCKVTDSDIEAIEKAMSEMGDRAVGTGEE